MVIEVVFKNGRKERMITTPTTTLVDFVNNAEETYGSRIQSMRVVKRNDSHRGGAGSTGH